MRGLKEANSGRWIVIIAALTLTSSVTFLVYQFEVDWVGISLPAAGSAMAAAISVLVFRMWGSLHSARVALVSKEAEVERVEAGSKSELTTVDQLKVHIRQAIGREEISMLRADGRANGLYHIGWTLMVVSVLCPLLAGVIYWRIDPLSSEIVERLKDLDLALGSLPEGSAVATERDWHVLLGGITFGFLCLAAARGILTQQGKEVAAHSRLSDRVNYYERVESVLEIRANGSGGEVDEKALVEFAIEQLLFRYESTTPDDDPRSEVADSAVATEALAKMTKVIPKSS